MAYFYLEDLAGRACKVTGSVTIWTGSSDNNTSVITRYKSSLVGKVVGVFTGTVYGGDDNNTDHFEYQCKYIDAYENGTFWIAGNFSYEEYGENVSYSRNTAQEELNKLLRDHKYIMQNLEASAMFAQDNAALGNAQYKGGLTVKQTIASLYSNLRERESQLIDDDLVESTATGYNSGAYTAGQDALANIIRTTSVNGVGAIPAVAIYVIVAVVSLAVGAYIYYKIKSMKEAADYDLNLSNEFLSWLKKQSPETTKIVLDQLKATGDSAYKAALNEKGTGLVNWIKNAGSGVKFALMAAGAFLVWTQVDKMQTNKAKRKFKYGR